MKVIILAGGLPSTLIEEDEKMPKPMAEIGGRPMLWHIMKQYAYYGYNDFNRVVKRGWEHFDNAVINKLRLLDKLNVKKVKLVGFDGFKHQYNESYADRALPTFLLRQTRTCFACKRPSCKRGKSTLRPRATTPTGTMRRKRATPAPPSSPSGSRCGCSTAWARRSMTGKGG